MLHFKNIVNEIVNDFAIFTGVAAIIQLQSFAMNSFDVVQVVFEHFPHLLSLTPELAHWLLTPLWFLCHMVWLKTLLLKKSHEQSFQWFCKTPYFATIVRLQGSRSQSYKTFWSKFTQSLLRARSFHYNALFFLLHWYGLAYKNSE